METRWRCKITTVASAENGAISVERVKVGKREKPKNAPSGCWIHWITFPAGSIGVPIPLLSPCSNLTLSRFKRKVHHQVPEALCWPHRHPQPAA